MAGVSLTWTPKEGLQRMTRNLRARQVLNKRLCEVMIALVNETHGRAGIPPWKKSQRAIDDGGRTGYKSGDLQRAWQPVPGKSRIENRKSYAVDFYYGHGPRTVQAPASYRRLRRGGSRRRTVGTTMVKAHTRRECAQVGRPIRWTKPYIHKAEIKILQHVIK